MSTLPKTICIAFALGAFLSTAKTSHAQSTFENLEASVDGTLIIPMSDWADIAGPGLGVILRGVMSYQNKLELTGRVGIAFHTSKDVGGAEISTSELLLLGGVRYDVGPVKLDLATGFNQQSFKYEVNGFSGSDSGLRIPLMLGAVRQAGKIEYGAGLMIPNLLLRDDEEDLLIGLTGTVGYRFH